MAALSQRQTANSSARQCRRRALGIDHPNRRPTRLLSELKALTSKAQLHEGNAPSLLGVWQYHTFSNLL